MDFEDIVVKESPGLCRCCLSEGCYKDLGTEYSWMNETEVYADILLECFDISITQHNDGPNGPSRLICEVCITRLRDACNFKKQVQESEKRFIDMVARGEFRPKMVIYQTQVKCEETRGAPAEVTEIEYLDDAMDFVDDTDDLKDESGPSVSEITVSSLPTKGKRGRPRKADGTVDKKAKVARVEDKAKSSKSVVKGLKARKEETYFERLAKIRNNVLLILRYGNVVPFTWHTKGYRCFYCLKPMRDCEILKEHTKKHFVDLDVFIPKRIVSKDIPIKIDISDLHCKICPDAKLKDLEDLIAHILFVHKDKYDTDVGVCVFPFVLDKDLMNCALCENQYDNFTSMIGHMHKEHVSHSCVCQICGLSFMTPIRLRRHISNSHVGFRCTDCGKIFTASHRLEKHKQQSHGLTKCHECSLCSATFDSPYQMKVHLGKMHNVEKYRIKCEHCSKICTTKGAMLLHVQSQHSDLKYECDLCEYKAAIKWLITLHKRKHFGERNYECSICERLFRRSSNLRAHMKVHSGVSGRVCRICKQGFLDIDTLKGHEARVHNKEVD